MLAQKRLLSVSSVAFVSYIGVLCEESDLVSDSGSFTSDVSELSRRNQELDEQVNSLRDQIKTYEEDIAKFETLQADWLNEKETLEGVLEELRNELKDKENDLNTVEAQKVGLTAKSYSKISVCLLNDACICS